MLWPQLQGKSTTLIWYEQTEYENLMRFSLESYFNLTLPASGWTYHVSIEATLQLTNTFF